MPAMAFRLLVLLGDGALLLVAGALPVAASGAASGFFGLGRSYRRRTRAMRPKRRIHASTAMKPLYHGRGTSGGADGGGEASKTRMISATALMIGAEVMVSPVKADAASAEESTALIDVTSALA